MTDIKKISQYDAGTPEADAQIPYSSNEPKTYKATPADIVAVGLVNYIIPSGEPATDETGYGIIETVTVDTNAVGKGAVLCLASDGHYDEADADAIATMKGLVLALDTSTGTKQVLRYGKFRKDSWNWTPGDIIYVSTTQGVLTNAVPTGADDVIKAVGVALTDDMIFFNPTETYITHTG